MVKNSSLKVRSLLYIFLLACTYSWVFSTVPLISEKEVLAQLSINPTLEDKEWIATLNKAGIYTEQPQEYSPTAETLSLPLFKKFPTLALTIPYISLGILPTPVHLISGLSDNQPKSIFYIKRDDLTGGIEQYGGNKVRKLEFLIADGLRYAAEHFITLGCAGSNHALATAAYVTRLGKKASCMLAPQANSHTVQQNLKLHGVYASDLHYYASGAMRKLGTIITWLEKYNIQGKFPYLIPTGGSNPRGIIGFVNAAFELQEQIDAGLLPEPDFIYVACGSMGTTAGLLLGCKAAGLRTKIVGVTVEDGSSELFQEDIIALARECNELLHHADPTFPLVAFSLEDIIVKTSCVGTGYGVFTEEGMHVRSILKDTNGILLDGTYTAKAFAGLIEDAAQGALDNKVVLFWNTYCGLDFSAVTQEVDYKVLPKTLHYYFETPVQALDA